MREVKNKSHEKKEETLRENQLNSKKKRKKKIL
jgi:hypothetical protein